MKSRITIGAFPEDPPQNFKVSRLEKLTDVSLPPVTVFEVEEVEPRELVVTESEVLSGDLDRLTGKALRKAEEILDLALNRHDDEFGLVLRSQTATLQSVLTTQTRVDENKLRKRQTDFMPELLERLARAEREMKVVNG